MADDKPTPPTTEEPGAARVNSTAEQDAAAREAAAREAARREEARAADMKAAPAAGKPRKGSWLTPLLRGLLFVVILLFLGALATYFLAYRPAEQQLQALRVEATQTANQLQQRESTLKQTQQDLESARANAGTAQEQLDVELARVAVLRSVNSLTFARMALQDKNKAGVIKALTDSEKQLQDVLPLVETRDADQASTLRALYTLAKNDLERDLALAGQDLDRIQSELERVEKNVLKAE